MSAFAKRGDVIVADRGINFLPSRRACKFSNQPFAGSIIVTEDVTLSIKTERRKPLTRRFIVTEAVFKKNGAVVDLPDS